MLRAPLIRLKYTLKHWKSTFSYCLSCVNARLHSPRTTESCSWDDIVARLAKECAQFEKEAAELRAHRLATSVTCKCCFFGCAFRIVWDEIDEARNTNTEEPDHDGEETREVFHISGLRVPDAVLVILDDFWGNLLDVAWKSGAQVVENIWQVTGQQLQDMFGRVGSLSAARLLPSRVRCWARVCCKVLCGECEPWNDSQALYDFFHLVLYILWMQSEGDAMILGRLDNEFQTAYHYEEGDGEEDSNGSEPIELDADDYSDSFIIGEKEQLEWWYLKNSGPQLQLYYTNEDYYQDQVEEERQNQTSMPKRKRQKQTSRPIRMRHKQISTTAKTKSKRKRQKQTSMPKRKRRRQKKMITSNKWKVSSQSTTVWRLSGL